jgi:NAD(P)H-nitrite reductase large subunit
MKNIVFVGNSIANCKAIEEIRKRDQESTITLVSADAFYPYGRGRLLAYLAREIKERQVYYQQDAFYKTHNVRVITNQPVTRFNFKRNQVFFENKEHLAYDILVLADLALPRLPEIKGHQKSGVYQAARLADVKTILEQIQFAETVAVQVTSLAGFLTLCALSNHGKELVVSFAASTILPDVLDPESSSILKQLMEYKGIRLMMENPIEEILGDSELKAVRMKSGKVLSTEMVILDDLRIDTRFFKDTGLELLKEEGGNFSQFRSNFSNVYWVDAIRNAFKAPGVSDYNISDEQLEGQGVALAQEILGFESDPFLFSSTTKFRLKDLTGFWFGQTNPSENSREFSRFDAEKNIYKKIFSSDGVLSGAVFLNADDQFDKMREMFNEKAGIQGIEEQILDDQLDLQGLVKLQEP